MRRVGVDVGGTFTDLILVDEETGPDHGRQGALHAGRPGARHRGGRSGALPGGGHRLGELDGILHGTTVATNIVLTHSGAEVGLITTDGFRDILHIARHKRPYNFSLHCELPWQSRPLVKRRPPAHRDERVTAPDGESSSRSTRTRSGSASAS